MELVFRTFSPTTYWYLIGGDEQAVEFASVEDVGADIALAISKVGFHHPFRAHLFVIEGFGD